MSNKTVLITGANGGIGFATVEKFLEQNFNVVGHYHKNTEKIEKICHERFKIVRGDFSKMKDVKNVFHNTIKHFGRLDVLFNNAGNMIVSKNITSINQTNFMSVFNVNFTSAFILSQLAMRHMKKNGEGRIINTSSIGVKYGGNPSTAPYTISKACIEAMTVLFAKEGAKKNVLVNAIRIGLTDTDFLNINTSKNLELRKKQIPLGRLAKVGEIASTVVYLASDESSFITGATITVAGGE